MRTLFVDDEPWMMKMFQAECKEIPLIELIGAFDSPLEALRFAQKNSIELAFLDVGMPKMNGIELGKRLRELFPELVLVYISAYDDTAARIPNDGRCFYLPKPYRRDDVMEVLKRAKLVD